MRETARNPRDARERYRRFIQQAVSCVSSTAVLFVGQTPSQEDHDLVSLGSREDPIALTTHEAVPLHLQLGQRGKVVPDTREGRQGEFRVTTLAYYYGVLDSLRQPLISWHWDARTHPNPHIHTTVNDPRRRGARLHIPTGGRRTSIEQVIRFLIDEWDVAPSRDDWEAVLDDTQARFDLYREWDRQA